MEKNQKAIKIFLDASVLVAAAFSQKGGSFRVLSEANLRGYSLYTTRYAYQEAENTIQQKKYVHKLPAFYNLPNFFIFSPEPPKKLVKEVLELIDFKDAPVLAGAIFIRADIIITLDRKHFLENVKLKEFYPWLQIMTPGDFIQKYFL